LFKTLHDDFLFESSKFELNIDGKLKQNIIQNYKIVDSLNQNDIDIIFDDTFNCVKMNIVDTWSRFVLSAFYIKLIKKISMKLIDENKT
jgi:hypothetical protein